MRAPGARSPRTAPARRRTAPRPPDRSTTVSVDSPSISGRATPASTGVTSPIHSDESAGESSGTGSIAGSRLPSARATTREHVAVGQHVRAADLDLAAGARGHPRRGAQVGDHVVGADRLRARPQPCGRDHHRQPVGEVVQRAKRLAAGADDHRGAEVGQRRPLQRQRQRGVVARAQMPGARLPEAAEVDDPADALARGHLGRSCAPPPARAPRSRRCRRGPSRGSGSRRRRCPRRRRAGCRRRARRPRAARSRRARARDGRRTRQRTSAPSSDSAAASRPPTNPVAPVTNAFTRCVRTAR